MTNSAHKPDCAITINARHGCSCGVESGENDLDFLREVIKAIKDGRKEDALVLLMLKRLLTIAVNQWARGDFHKFWNKHEHWTDFSESQPYCKFCAVNGKENDPRHTWSLEDWQKAKWKEVEGRNETDR